MPTSDLTAWQPRPRPQPVTLRGQYVAVEPLEASQHAAALWQAVRGQEAVWKWLGDAPYPDEASLQDALGKKQAAEDAVFFAIVPADTGLCAGYLSLMRIDAANGVVEVGNVLLSPALQQTRAATEAQYLLARHVFDDLGYRRYEWKCNALNEPSRRAALRLGFTFEGIFRQHMIVKGCNRDTAWFAMLDGEWPARRHAFEQWLAPANFDREGRQLAPLARA